MQSAGRHAGILFVLFAASTLANAADDKRPPAASQPAAASRPAEAPPAKLRAPLVREGAFLVEAVGSVRRDAAAQQWLFTPKVEDEKEPVRDFILLPSQGLDDMVRVAEDPRQQAVFEVTGEVFVYAGRNLLLPIMASPLIDQVEAPRRAGSAESEAIERQLEKKVGPAPRSAGPKSTDGGVEASAAAGATVESRVASRRATVVRNGATGGWRVVFEADAQGHRDADMDLMPCLTLERIERLARQSGGPLTVEISGRVFVSRGRSYLMPTRFTVPVNSTPLKRPTPNVPSASHAPSSPGAPGAPAAGR
jgi:hypothetical protein